MNILIHFIIGILVGYTLFAANVFNLTLFWTFVIYTVALDIDHVIYFLTVHKKKAWKAAMYHRKTMTPAFYVLHSPELNIALLILAFFHPIALAIFLASILHFLLDMLESYLLKGNVRCVLSWSIICQISRRKHE